MAVIKFSIDIAGNKADCEVEVDNKNLKKFQNSWNKEKLLKNIVSKQCIITGYEIKEDFSM